eukprot:TRINITY_DN24863_c0_g1_i1.p1 TRINITY_DN24863_c0_g1~~TRINITY_DN24863_c0_g1_i1.p1  ORF type:complete len:310 (+),score=121.78 TRINITY_DN24863_c0_g1_i1:86-1015(+)
MGGADDAVVLSVQSHVVHGYVGNRCAAFALQLLGFEVDVLNTVQFSNHTGYPAVKGTRLGGEDLKELAMGLVENKLAAGYTHFLTGYIGSVEFLQHVSNVLATLRAQSPRLKYICDPVMGDNGRLYVSKEMVPEYRKLIALADVVTPNQFEAELLSGMEIASMADAHRVCAYFHDMGIQRVVLTSVELAERPGIIFVIGSDAGASRYVVEVPKLDCYFTGTGDLMAALLLGRGELEPSLQAALATTVSTVQDVITTTQANYEARRAASAVPLDDPSAKAEMLNAKELCLVKARTSIMTPSASFHATLLE